MLDSEAEARNTLRQLEESGDYSKQRLMSLDVYEDGHLVLEGTEFYTEQSGLDSFAADGGYHADLLNLAENADQLSW